MKKLIIALVAILICLIGVAGFCIYLEFFKTGDSQAELSVPSVSQESESPTLPTPSTDKPVETFDPAVLTTASEETEETTEEQTAPPDTTEEEEENPEDDIPDVDVESIDGDVTNSGSFSSYTGTNLDLIVDWKTFTDSDGDLKVRMNFSLNCNNLYVGYRYGGIYINLGGNTMSLDTDAISHTGGGTNILIGSCIMNMPEDTADVSVSWAYKGTYNGVSIDYISASGSIYR